MEVIGSDIVERIDSLLKEKNLKRKALTEAVGLSLQSITNWKKQNSIPSADTALRIAQFLGVSVEWLITGIDPQGLTAPERDLLEQYRALSVSDKEEIHVLLQLKYNKTL